AMSGVVARQARVLAHVADIVMARFEARCLLLSVSPEIRPAFIEALPGELKRRHSGDFAVGINAGRDEVAAAAEPAQRAVEEREEVRTIRRLIEAGPNDSAWG